MANLVEKYGDLPLGTTDAAVVAVAQRLRCAVRLDGGRWKWCGRTDADVPVLRDVGEPLAPTGSFRIEREYHSPLASTCEPDSGGILPPAALSELDESDLPVSAVPRLLRLGHPLRGRRNHAVSGDQPDAVSY